MRFLLTALLWLSFIWPIIALAQEAPKRVALVIGNSDYTYVPALQNPANDASDIAAALKRLGFDVALGINQDDAEMRDLLQDFSILANNAELSLVYFAGHGIEIEKKNYLIPVNAKLKNDWHAEVETIPLDAIMQSLSDAKGVKFVLVDACRNNPFAARLKAGGSTRSIGRGLARVDSIGGVSPSSAFPGGLMISYAAREGTLALDGSGRNSPYAQGLLQYFEEPGLEVSKFFRKVRDRVFEITGGRQEPFTYGSLPGVDIYLKRPIVQAAMSAGGEALALDIEAARHMNTFRGWQLLAGKHPNRAFLPETLTMTEKTIVRELRDTTSGVFFRGDPAEIPREVSVQYERVFGLSRGDVLVTQAFLARNGYKIGTIDGELGPKSRRALAEYQASKGIAATGIVTPATAVSLGLRLEWWKQVWPISSTLGRRYDLSQVQRLETDIRLHNLLRVYRKSRMIYGFHESHLYAGIERRDSTYEISQGFAARAGGQLAVVTSPSENEFIYEMIKHDGSLWLPKDQFHNDGTRTIYGPSIGLSRDSASGNWNWINGEDLRYSNWNIGQPNSNTNANYAAFQFQSRAATLRRGRPSPKWSARNYNMRSIIVELD